ncbi:MAG: hypothetical protein JWN27_4553 [Candidatus Eremiobacteraeota bacterium]|nr:hypothetical protein [Candidatus Eremiobacteraeota bacterium]
MLSHIGRAALATSVLLSLAACGGGPAGIATPPAVSAGAGANAPASLVYTLSGGAATFDLPVAGEYGGTVSFPAFAAPAGATVAASASTDSPASTAQATSRRPAETGTTTIFFYVTLTAAVTITLPSTPGFSIIVPRSLAQQNPSIFYAISGPTASGAVASFRTEGPATLAGTKASFAPTNVPLTLHARTRYVFAFYAQALGSTGPFVYVADGANNAIDAFALGDSGDIPPDFTIAGPATQLDLPVSLARDSAGNLYVGNRTTSGTAGGTGSITVYAKGARGNAAPIRTIAGDLTGLTNLWAIAVDAGGQIFAAQLGARRSTGSVRIFAAGAHGNAAPSRVITTDLIPIGIAVDAQDETFVANLRTQCPCSSVDAFDASADGNATPIRAITGGPIAANISSRLAIDQATGQLSVAGGNLVSLYPILANGNVAPTAQLGGSNTGLVNPSGIAFTADTLVVSDAATWNVRTYARSPLGNVAPLRVIGGPLTTLGSANDIVILP